MKWVHLSLIKVKGQPNLVIIFSYINLAASSLVHYSTSPTSFHFVTYYYTDNVFGSCSEAWVGKMSYKIYALDFKC